VGQGAHLTLEQTDEQGPVGEISRPLFLGDSFFVDWLSIGERSSIGLPAVGGLFHHTKGLLRRVSAMVQQITMRRNVEEDHSTCCGEDRLTEFGLNKLFSQPRSRRRSKRKNSDVHCARQMRTRKEMTVFVLKKRGKVDEILTK
jgi:hypothetical protein